MSRPASITSAPSVTSADISSRSAAPDAARRPSSGPPAAPPAESGTGTPSPTAAGNPPSPPPCVDFRKGWARLRAAWEAGRRAVSGEILLLRSLLPPATPDLSPEAARSWVVLPGERHSACAFPGEIFLRPPFGPLDLVLSLFPYEGQVREGRRAAK